MAKLTLVTSPEPEYLHLLSPWVPELTQDYFDVEPYDPAKTYNPNQHCVFINYVDQLEGRTWYHPLRDVGHRILVEHLGDSDVDRLSAGTKEELVLRSPNWMWYNACLEWRWYGLDQYQPNRNYRYSFLMLMNLRRWHRDRIMIALHDLLPRALYSYASRGRELPGTPPLNIPWRGWLNPEWYDSTPFTVVVESYMRSRGSVTDPSGSNYRTEVSEKLFKPMLGQQPFIVYGSVDTVKYLHREGFVTYDNLFDETYDQIVDDIVRFDAVTRVVQQATVDYNYSAFRLDPESTERIRHNHARLFDHALVKQRFQEEVVKDIMDWWHL